MERTFTIVPAWMAELLVVAPLHGAGVVSKTRRLLWCGCVG